MLKSKINNNKSNLLLLVCVSFTIIGQPRNSVLIRRVYVTATADVRGALSEYAALAMPRLAHILGRAA